MSAPNFRGGVSAPNLGGCLLQILGGGLVLGGVFQFLEYGQRSAGTHPTGMHSCYKFRMLRVLLSYEIYCYTTSSTTNVTSGYLKMFCIPLSNVKLKVCNIK